MPRPTRRRLGLAAVAIVLILLVLKSCWPEPDNRSLLDLLIDYRAELEAPGLTINDAARNLENLNAAFAFVRDRTLYAPYFGRRQSPETVLRTRSGNAADRAFLLAALLNTLGWQTEVLFANGQPDDSPPASGSFTRRKSATLGEIARRIGYDLDGETAEREADAALLNTTFSDMRGVIDRATALLDERLSYSYAGYGESSPDSIRAIVRAERKGKRTRFLDPTWPDLEIPQYDAVFWRDPPEGTIIQLWMRDSAGANTRLLDWQGETAGRDIELRFLPTHDPLGAMMAAPAPNAIGLWTPVLSIEDEVVTGRPFTTDAAAPGGAIDTPPPADTDPTALLDPRTITGMKLAGIDASGYPLVRAQLVLDGAGGATLSARHFTLTDNGAPVSPHLDRLTLTGGVVSIVTDVSPSMVDIEAFELSKQAVIGLSEMLGAAQTVGLISFAGEAHVEVALAPLGDGAAIRAAAEGLTSRGSTGIYYALEAALRDDGLTGGTIVLLTDGEDNVGGSEEDVISALRARNVRVIALGLGEGADHALLERIAQASGGTAIEITDVDDLERVFDQIGGTLTTRATLSYLAPAPAGGDAAVGAEGAGETAGSADTGGEGAAGADGAGETPAGADGAGETPAGADDAGETPAGADDADASDATALHRLDIRLSGTSISAHGRYAAPPADSHAAPRLYMVFRTDAATGDDDYPDVPWHKEHKATRNLYRLDDPNIGWALSGRTTLFFDHGRIAPDILTAAYISGWIDVLRARDGALADIAADARLRPSYDLVTTINGFRTLTAGGSGTGARLSGGVNIYMRRTTVAPGPDGFVEHSVFDVVDRWSRAVGAADQGETQRIDMAANIAEGLMIGGEDAVSALMDEAETLTATSTDAPMPTDWPARLREVAPGFAAEDTWLLTSPAAPDWFWRADTSSDYAFAGYYLGGGALAKGASIEALAAEFDKIDKFYAYYASIGSKTPGLNSSIGVLLKAIAAFKREENKLWCYSTLMMGYVANSIGDETALLNRSPQEAQANAARLCKMNYNPDDFARAAGTAAADAMVKAWVKKGIKNEIKSIAAGFGLGSTASTAAAEALSGPVTNGFHDAMAAAITE